MDWEFDGKNIEAANVNHLSKGDEEEEEEEEMGSSGGPIPKNPKVADKAKSLDKRNL
jgi:hypothetical protein